ncbi:ubiquinol-cytochrome-c reductase complex subunit (QCR10) domain-containing protein [Purpureocillium lilacinum]|uniref:Ubiquinol-cytochrome-c reductase complex subunit (QCR10) domain-containing protein n=2 Tax=Purpureocillium lilacinum TaxID=33203 RepID=A0A179HKX0_PURLI|nr:ubiquinol-cytochrome-c reductase complex subunit (QCR10) domain-containing protein [Purpureocillium lilacinum]OAQ88064.1 ubiquinol-cytochrome-c reductase complex subunit (QCR10) domain-containing protein [Purpureocillium lilacinum]OAQ90119.1 ubiquinol-cytochrome-c reductase complex subunit (QCR10) domain-containing protein [Purpureocillium lilacinum]GJN69773.1 hypothetical protein PLICBS_003825 [Purpureocillium lilacinum]
MVSPTPFRAAEFKSAYGPKYVTIARLRRESRPSRMAPNGRDAGTAASRPVETNIRTRAPELTEPSTRYHYQPNFHGMNKTSLFRLGLRTASFGGAGVIAALLYVSGIPRVQRDVLQQIPVVGKYFIKEELPASDNPF